MSSKLKEYILHRDSVQFAYISMEQTLFQPWALEFAVAHPDKIRACVLFGTQCVPMNADVILEMVAMQAKMEPKDFADMLWAAMPNSAFRTEANAKLAATRRSELDSLLRTADELRSRMERLRSGQQKLGWPMR